MKCTVDVRESAALEDQYEEVARSSEESEDETIESWESVQRGQQK